MDRLLKSIHVIDGPKLFAKIINEDTKNNASDTIWFNFELKSSIVELCDLEIVLNSFINGSNILKSKRRRNSINLKKKTEK